MRIDVNSVDRFKAVLQELDKMHAAVYIFGAGNYGRILGDFLNQKEIEWKGYIDSDASVIHETVCGRPVYGVHEVDGKDAYVLVSVSKRKHIETYGQIIQTIKEIGIDDSHILDFDDNFQLMDDIVLMHKNAGEFLKKLKGIKGKYQGEKCFIIGNGPSLRLKDLERLSGYITMGCNEILDLYSRTDWRPTCFFIIDAQVVLDYIHDVDDLEYILSNCDMLFSAVNNNIFDQYHNRRGDIYFLNTRRRNDASRFSDQADKVVYDSGTTLYSMFQVAVYMGIKEIYLLGVDNTFRKEIYEDGTLAINEEIQDHMELMNCPSEGIYYKDLIEAVFRKAKEYADSHGIKVFNATRGGCLEVFERVDFDSLFQ